MSPIEWIANARVAGFLTAAARSEACHINKAVAKAFIAIACAFTCVALEADIASATEYKDNPYAIVDRTKYPQFGPLGLIKRDWDFQGKERSAADRSRDANHGTAINIGPCLVITNDHVVFGGGGAGELLGIKKYNVSSRFPMIYYSGVGNIDGGFASKSRLYPIIGTGGENDDITVLRDEGCSGMKYGWYDFIIPKYIGDFQDKRTPLLSVSFPGDLPFGQMVISKGLIRGFVSLGNLVQDDSGSGSYSDGGYKGCGTVYYDSSTAPGSSGGAVLVIGPDGVLRLLGVHCGGAKLNGQVSVPTYSEAAGNEFVSSDWIFGKDATDKIMAAIAADRRQHPGPNPIEAKLHVR